MDSDSVQAELSALRKLYRLLQINESSERSSISEILDGESRVLLRKLLDDASERVFEAHMKIMADNWRSLLGTQCLDQPEEAKRIEISRPSTPSTAAKSSIDHNIKENVECHPTLPVTSRLRRSVTEVSEKTQSVDNSLNPLNEVKKIPTEACSSMAPKKEEGKKASNVEDFSKEVDDAIRRIESLIPSLHRLAKPVLAPIGKQIGNLNSFRKTNSLLDLDRTNGIEDRRLLLPPQRSDYESLKEDEFEQDAKSLKNTVNQTQPIPQHIQEMRILPSQFNENSVNQYRVPQREVRRKTPTSRPSLLPPSTSSTSFGKTRRKTGSQESKYWPQQGNFLPPFDESEETSSGSPGSSSWTTVEGSSSSSPSDTIQTTSSCTDENEDSRYSGSSSQNYQDVESELSQASSRYDHEGDSNPSEYYQSSHQSVEHRQAGKFKRLKNKLGLIFHHHHHHHHHHHDKGGQAPGSVWKNIGKMFRHTEKEEAKNPKDKTFAKSGSYKQQAGNLHTFVEGLMRQAKHTKKPKKGKGLGKNKVGKKKPSRWKNKANVNPRGRNNKPQGKKGAT